MLQLQDSNLYMMYRITDGKMKYAPLYVHKFSLVCGNRKKKSVKCLPSVDVESLSIADKLRHYRTREHLRQDDVAEIAGISRVTYCKYEKGVTYYPFKVMLRLAERYEIEADDLLDDYHRFIYNGQGNHIRAIREALGLKQHELADILEVTVSSLKRNEQGRLRMTREIYEKLMSYYSEYLTMLEDNMLIAVGAE